MSYEERKDPPCSQDGPHSLCCAQSQLSPVRPPVWDYIRRLNFAHKPCVIIFLSKSLYALAVPTQMHTLSVQIRMGEMTIIAILSVTRKNCRPSHITTTSLSREYN